ncbi:C2 domain-containing protein, partial [Catenaria anguillulae PL171]
MRIHQQQINAVLQAEQDLIAVQKQKYESETGQAWPGPQPYQVGGGHHEQHQHQHQPPAAEGGYQYQQPPAECLQPPPPPQFHLNKLIIELVEARDLPKTDFLSEIDPYVIVTAGSERHKSKAFKDAGCNPNFGNLQMHVPVGGETDEVVLEAWDSNKFLADDFLGRGSFYINNSGLRRGEAQDFWMCLVGDDGQTRCGEVHLRVSPCQ